MTRGLLAAGCAAWLALPAAAQQIELAPSEALACLTPDSRARAALEYPFEQYKRAVAGRVKVELAFARPGVRPQVTVLERAGGAAFVDAVTDHVRNWRVPCLPAGATARLVHDYVFEPDRREAVYADTRDADERKRAERLACLTHASGERSPGYPLQAQRRGVQGRIYAFMRFTAPDKPPQVRLEARDSARSLVESLEPWMRDYRLPCLQADETVQASAVYVFRFEGEAWGFKPMTLPNLLVSTKGIRKQALAFDTTTMGCPFDLRLTYLQPSMANLVGELGSVDPARRPLIEWMKTVELDLRPAQLDVVWADNTTVTVPCLKIDLNRPKEPS